MATNRHLTLADLAEELCDGRQHVERIPYWDTNRNRKYHVHKVVLPGLLQQMADLFIPSSNPDGGSTAATSKPPVNWAALADHMTIAADVAKWCLDLGIPQRDTVEGNIRALVGAAGNLDSDTRDRLTRDMRRWHRIAEYITGWRTPPAEVRAPCPALNDEGRECKARTLRVNLATSEAYCATCGTTWDHTNIGLLAETVRAYNRVAQAEAEVAKARARAAKRRGAA